MLDAIEQYIVGSVQFSRKRVQMLERVQVGLVGLCGADEAMTVATHWAYGEDREVMRQIGDLCVRFDAAAEKLQRVNDAVDTRLAWIDTLAQALFRERSKWIKDVQKAASGSSNSVGRL